jgi:hypothetical protein
MLFECSITIPKATASTSPTAVILKVSAGVITKVMVRPRPGHSAVAHCVILHHEHQVWPSTETMEMHGDTFPIDWEEHYEIDQPPYELKIEGWNDSTLYSHTFDVYIAMLPTEVINPEGALVTGLRRFLGMVGIKL